MTAHEEYGLSEPQSAGLGQGIISIVAYGLSTSLVTALAEGAVGPGISSVVAINSTKVRITFDSQMTDDAALIDLDNYTIAPTGLGVSVYKVSMEAEGITYPNYVDITISEMTGGQIYQAEIETGAGGPTGRYGDSIDVTKSLESFTGVGINPEIKYIESLSEDSVKVVFTEAMEDNAKIRDVANYSFDNGLTISEVTSVSVDTVYLKTSEQTSGLLYTLTITS